ncbi:MAG: transposase, partial [Chloroflexi bacterium]|nr:transposase [Chloroflexota bacterium]
YAHYHKRSNVETAFSMIKAKFGASVRSRTEVAQVNEVLAKILCHNICVLILSIFELDVMPAFQARGLLAQKADLYQKSA